MTFDYNLNTVLEEIGETRNTIAVESKIRPATVYDMCEGKTKRIELSTLESILQAINKIARSKGIEKTYTLDDLLLYKYEKDAE